MQKLNRSYLLYGTESYISVLEECAKSIREFSNIHILIYLINSDKKINLENSTTINWEMDLSETDLYTQNSDGNFYIKREKNDIFKILTERVKILKDSLLNRSEIVTYIDSDSVATHNIDRIFDLYQNQPYVMATEGIHDWLHVGDRGGSMDPNDLSTTLEHPACELFKVNQYVRERYRTTNIFIAGQNSLDFIDEWISMCNHPEVLKNKEWYASYHEETLYNVLLWKYNYIIGLPYLYTNGTVEDVVDIYEKNLFTGNGESISEWKRFPTSEKNLLVFHGEKRIEKMSEMRQILKDNNNKILGKSFDRFEPLVLNTTPNLIKILFLAPHLSTGGMPSFLLKRIESLLEYSKELELYVVEFSNHSDHFVVQKNKIKELLPPSHFWTLGQDKMELINIIEENEFDIIHLDEMIEAFDFHNPMTPDLMNYLYKNDRTWKIVETCHNIIFQPNLEKHFHPESYAYCTPWHKENTFKEMPSYGEVFEFPIENKIPSSTEKIESKLKLGFNPNKKHVVNVGLWTSGKNQKEGVELARLIEKTNPEYQFHFVGNQAPNFQDYWQPLMNDLPSNVKVWGERNDVNLFLTASDIFMFNSTWECNPLVLRESISYGLPTLSRNLPQYMDMFTNYIHPIDDDINKTKETLLSLKEERHFNIPEGQGEKFALDHFKFYQLVNSKEPKQQTKINSNIKIIQYFVNQPFLEIKGNSDSTFEIKFFDEFGVCHYQNKTKSNHWFKLNRQYFTKWNTKVWEDGTLIYDDTLNYKGKKVFISFDSGSLGDTIAWIPYVLEFKKKHECDVVVSTHKNFLFEKVYPELEFVKPGSTVNGIHGMYVIGWFYDPDKEPMMPNTIPLQQAATNILGLDYTEIQPRIDYVVGERPYEQKYVSIATNSTAGCKFWTKEGWQGLINHLHSLGYKVINVSKEKNPFNNSEQISNTSMENTMNVIHHSEFFIGLSSGLSWLAWGMGKHVVMISNFTEPDHEFTTNCTRIVKLDVCNGCWNSPIYKFDKGNFNWCPLHEGTSRQFECHTTITSDMVIKQIQHLLT
jgi:autotransporter strand-loop-strand O-heptosyltransferase